MPIIIGILAGLVVFLPTWLIIAFAVVTIFGTVHFVQSNFGERSGIEVFGVTLAFWIIVGVEKFILVHLHWVW